MNYPSREVIEELKAKYKPGAVVILDKMTDEQAPEIGTAGVVTSVDDIGTVHVDWLTGSTLGVAYPVDEVHIANSHESALYYMGKESKRQKAEPDSTVSARAVVRRWMESADTLYPEERM